jgi:gp16 family phage-associated protein
MQSSDFRKRKAAVKAAFAARGESFKSFAARRGYSVKTVYAVLNGQKKGTRGITHCIAVDLGLKPRQEPTANCIPRKPLSPEAAA